MAGEKVLNGVNVTEFREYVEQVRKNPSVAERNPKIIAQWVGGTRARVEQEGNVLYMGGDGDLSAMGALLATLAACDVEVVANHASLLGLKIENLEVEATGHFNVRRYLGLDGPGSGYDRIAYTVRIRAPGATKEQIEQLKAMCERGSPVGDSLARSIPLELKIEAR